MGFLALVMSVQASDAICQAPAAICPAFDTVVS